MQTSFARNKNIRTAIHIYLFPKMFDKKPRTIIFNNFQPDYEQQAIEESRFRQQLEARNKQSKKQEKKHGKEHSVS